MRQIAILLLFSSLSWAGAFTSPGSRVSSRQPCADSTLACVNNEVQLKSKTHIRPYMPIGGTGIYLDWGGTWTNGGLGADFSPTLTLSGNPWNGSFSAYQAGGSFTNDNTPPAYNTGIYTINGVASNYRLLSSVAAPFLQDTFTAGITARYSGSGSNVTNPLGYPRFLVNGTERWTGVDFLSVPLYSVTGTKNWDHVMSDAVFIQPRLEASSSGTLSLDRVVGVHFYPVCFGSDGTCVNTFSTTQPITVSAIHGMLIEDQASTSGSRTITAVNGIRSFLNAGTGGTTTYFLNHTGTAPSVIDGTTSFYPDMVDPGAGGTLEAFKWNPTLTTSATSGSSSNIYGFHLNFGTTSGGLFGTNWKGVYADGTISATATTLGQISLFHSQLVSQSTTSSVLPENTNIFFDESSFVTSSGAAHGSGGLYQSFNSNPLVKASGASTTWTLTDFNHYRVKGKFTADTVGNSLTVTNHRGLYVEPNTLSATGSVTVVNEIGVDVGALIGSSSTTIAAVRSAITANASNPAKYFLLDTGGAQNSIAGKFTKYNNITLSGDGLPYQVANYDAANLTANDNSGSARTLYTPTASGFYRITIYTAIVTAASSTSTRPSVAIGWTDPDSNVAQSNTAIATSATNSTTTATAFATLTVYAKTGVAITSTSAGYASNAAGMTYSLHIRVESLG